MFLLITLIEVLFNVFFIILAAAVFYKDYRYRVIPNTFIIVGFIIGALFYIYSLIQAAIIWYDPLAAAVGVFVVLGVVTSLYLAATGRQAIGWGDIKYLSLIGFLIGSKPLVFTMILTFILSGIFVLILGLFRVNKINQSIPLGPFISVCAMISLFILKQVGI